MLEVPRADADAFFDVDPAAVQLRRDGKGFGRYAQVSGVGGTVQIERNADLRIG